MRLFAAVELDAGVVAALEAATSSLADVVRGITPVRKDALHLTLRFYGDLPEQETGRLRGIFARAHLASTGGDIVVGGYGQFPPQGSPRVLYAGLREGAETVTRLWAEIRDLTSFIGRPPEETYVPHVTLARDKRGALRGRSEALAALKDAVDALALESAVRAVRLYHSVLGPGGPRYTVLEEALCARST